jgi:hypothetical protein
MCSTRNGAVASVVPSALTRGPAHFDWRLAVAIRSGTAGVGKTIARGPVRRHTTPTKVPRTSRQPVRLINGGRQFGFEEFVVRSSQSIAPNGLERDVFLVLDDFGSLGRVWRESDEAGTNGATLVRNLLEGQYENPVRIVAFNIAEGWCRDVTMDIADELRCSVVEYGEISQSAIQFMQANQR